MADISILNVLQYEQLEEKVGETSNVGADPIDAEQDKDIYVTPSTMVHSGVFVDEVLGNTIIKGHISDLR